MGDRRRSESPRENLEAVAAGDRDLRDAGRVGGADGQGLISGERSGSGEQQVCPLVTFVENAMRAALRAFALITVFVLASLPRSALAQPAPPPDEQQPAYAPGELANAGQPFSARSRAASPP